MRNSIIVGMVAAAVAAVSTVPGPARADVIIAGITYIDPTSFHVTSSVATGSDPVLLNSNTAFSIQDNGGQNISHPLTVFIAGPVGSTAPVITAESYTSPNPGSTTTPIAGPFTRTLFGANVSIAGSDLYTAVGCVACDNSLNQANIDAAYGTIGLSNTTDHLTIWSFSVPQDFVGKDQVNFVGTFANGDIVFPFAQNGAGTDKVTIFDTSWTNAGLVDCPPGNTHPGCNGTTPPPPPPPPVPEPASLALLGVGLLGLGFVARRKRH